LLPPQIAKSGEIPTKFDLTAGHPKSSILVSKYTRTIIVSKATKVTAQALYNHRGRKC